MRNMKVKDFFVNIARKIKANFGWKSALFLGICIAMLAIDLLTKHFEEADNWNFTVIPGFIEVSSGHRNDGASLGWLSEYEWGMSLLIALTCIAVPVFILVVLLLPERAALLKFCVYMALAGALGNLVDRIALGEVRDFIGMNFGFVSFHCNFADIWLMVGLVVAILDLLFFSEWAVFPLTKKAREAQAEQRRREEEKKLQTPDRLKTSASEGGSEGAGASASADVVLTEESGKAKESDKDE